MDSGEDACLHGLVRIADYGLERSDDVADHIFGPVVQQHGDPGLAVKPRPPMRDGFDQQRVLCDRENMRARSLAVPARDTGEAVRDIRDFDVERGRIEQIEPAPRQHALPGARRVVSWTPARSRRRRSHGLPASFANAACRWQVTRWSLTMPTACMKA